MSMQRGKREAQVMPLLLKFNEEMAFLGDVICAVSEKAVFSVTVRVHGAA